MPDERKESGEGGEGDEPVLLGPLPRGNRPPPARSLGDLKSGKDAPGEQGAKDHQCS